jgi:hypothetical protein
VIARSVRVVAAAALLCVALVPLTTMPAAGQDAGTFSGTAVADGVRVNVAIPDYQQIEDYVDGGGPSAQAVLDSHGVSRAFSSFPYPGAVGVAATGLVSTLTGFSLPSYPLIANSSFPTELERNIDQPGFHLNAASTEEKAVGDARFGETTPGGALEGGGFSHASVDRDAEGNVVASAEARFSLVVGPVAFRAVRAVAEVTRAADGTTTPSSSLQVGSLSIGGIELALTDKGLVLAGTPLIPIDAITGLTSALTLGTTKVTFVPQAVTEDSVLSAGLLVETVQTVPGIEKELHVSYRLGNVYAAATSAAFAADAEPSLPLPDEATIDLGSAGDVTAPDVAAPSTGRPVVDAPLDSARRVGSSVRVSSWTFFPILAVAGLALLVSALGERWQHTRDSTRGEP